MHSPYLQQLSGIADESHHASAVKQTLRSPADFQLVRTQLIALVYIQYRHSCFSMHRMSLPTQLLLFTVGVLALAVLSGCIPLAASFKMPTVTVSYDTSGTTKPLGFLPGHLKDLYRLCHP